MKNRIPHRIVAISTALLLLLPTLPLKSFAAEENASADFLKLEVSPAYAQYLEDLENGDIDKYNGYIPDARPPMSIPLTKSRSAAVSLPSSYDPRKTQEVTSVKQQTGDICWAYAAVASLESLILRRDGITKDYSENYFNYLTASNALASGSNPYAQGYDRLLDSGGQSRFAFTSMLNWHGPVLESQFKDVTGPLENISVLTSIQPDLYMTGYQEINELKSPTEAQIMEKVKRMKQLLYEGRALTLGLLSMDGPLYNGEPTYIKTYYNDIKHAQYIPLSASLGEGYEQGNHEVTIVGWDDTYSKSNFTIEPPGNGAFIVKNSLGTRYNDAGYFYLSYYDYFVIQHSVLAADTTQSRDTYLQNYNLSNVDRGVTISVASNYFWHANVFWKTHGVDEYVDAVGFSTASYNTNYEIYICPSKDLGSKPMTKVKEGTLQNPGYYTVPLDVKQFLQTEDGYFAVAIRLSVDNGNIVIPVSNMQYPKSNSSYYKMYDSSQSDWNELKVGEDEGNKANFNIRAFTKQAPAANISFSQPTFKLFVGEEQTLSATVSPATANPKITWTSSNEDVASVSMDDGLVTGKQSGTAVITATPKLGTPASCTVVVDDAGDDFASAKTIYPNADLLIRQEGHLGIPQDVDVFRLTAHFTDPTKSYVLCTTDAQTNVKGWLYDSDGNLLKSDDGSGHADFKIIQTLNKNETYYLKISHINQNGTGSYTLNISPAEGAMNTRSAVMEYNETKQLYTSVGYIDGGAVSWSSDNPNVASVDSSGLVTAHTSGVATISATSADGQRTASCPITVDDYPNSYYYPYPWPIDEPQSENTISGYLGHIGDVDAFSFAPLSMGMYKIVADPNITLSVYGIMNRNYIKVEPKAEDSTLYLIYCDDNASPHITVSAKETGYIGAYSFTIRRYNAVQSVRLNAESVTLQKGGTQILEAAVIPDDADNPSVIWESSRPDIVSVGQEGAITGLAYGVSTITVTTQEGGYQDTCKVYVVPSGEIGNTTATAYNWSDELTQGTVNCLPGALETKSDVDVYKFTAETNGYCKIFSSDSTTDVKVSVSDGNSNTIVTDDNSGENNNFATEFNISSGQTYYISVSHTTRNGTGNYVLNLAILTDGIYYFSQDLGCLSYINDAVQVNLNRDYQANAWRVQSRRDGIFSIALASAPEDTVLTWTYYGPATITAGPAMDYITEKWQWTVDNEGKSRFQPVDDSLAEDRSHPIGISTAGNKNTVALCDSNCGWTLTVPDPDDIDPAYVRFTGTNMGISLPTAVPIDPAETYTLSLDVRFPDIIGYAALGPMIPSTEYGYYWDNGSYCSHGESTAWNTADCIKTNITGATSMGLFLYGQYAMVDIKNVKILDQAGNNIFDLDAFIRQDGAELHGEGLGFTRFTGTNMGISLPTAGTIKAAETYTLSLDACYPNLDPYNRNGPALGPMIPSTEYGYYHWDNDSYFSPGGSTAWNTTDCIKTNITGATSMGLFLYGQYSMVDIKNVKILDQAGNNIFDLDTFINQDGAEFITYEGILRDALRAVEELHSDYYTTDSWGLLLPLLEEAQYLLQYSMSRSACARMEPLAQEILDTIQNRLTLKEIEVFLNISDGVVLPSETEGKYNITWNANVVLGENTTLEMFNDLVKVKEYGVYYAANASYLENLSNADPATYKKMVLGEGDDIDVYSIFGFRLKGVSPSRTRAAMFYIVYEYDGGIYTTVSSVCSADTPDIVSIRISADEVVPSETEGRYNITWNAHVVLEENTSLETFNKLATIKEYGVYYAQYASSLEDLANADPATYRKTVLGEGDSIDIYTYFGFRLNNVPPGRSRSAMFYMVYEYAGSTYTAISPISTAETPAN